MEARTNWTRSWKNRLPLLLRRLRSSGPMWVSLCEGGHRREQARGLTRVVLSPNLFYPRAAGAGSWSAACALPQHCFASFEPRCHTCCASLLPDMALQWLVLPCEVVTRISENRSQHRIKQHTVLQRTSVSLSGMTPGTRSSFDALGAPFQTWLLTSTGNRGNGQALRLHGLS